MWRNNLRWFRRRISATCGRISPMSSTFNLKNARTQSSWKPSPMSSICIYTASCKRLSAFPELQLISMNLNNKELQVIYARNSLCRSQSWCAAYSFSASVAKCCRLRWDIYTPTREICMHSDDGRSNLREYSVVVDEFDQEAQPLFAYGHLCLQVVIRTYQFRV